MKDEATERRLTKICMRHHKIDCELCKKTHEWDELLRRISRPPNVPTSGRTIKDLTKVS